MIDAGEHIIRLIGINYIPDKTLLIYIY